MCDKPCLRDRHLRETYDNDNWKCVPYNKRHLLKSGTRVRRYIIPIGTQEVIVEEFTMATDIYLGKGTNLKTIQYYREYGYSDVRFVSDLFNGEVWIKSKDI